VPQTTGPISAASWPKFTILWGHLEEILPLNKFFPIVDTCLSCEDIARQSCAMVPRWRFLTTFWILHFQRAACSTFQTCILNHTKATCTMCGSMADIQSATAEIRRGEKKERRKKKPQGKNIMVCPIPYRATIINHWWKESERRLQWLRTGM